MKNLNAKHLRAAEMLIEGSTPDEIAKDIGVVPSTISGWMIDKVFLRGWKKRRIEFAEEAVKFSDLSERVPSVVAAVLNSSSESNRLRATEVYMRGVELERERQVKEGINRTPAEELEEEERGDLIRNGILVGIGDWCYLRERNAMGYDGGVKYWDELNAEELHDTVNRKHIDALKWGKAGGNAMRLGGVVFALANPEASRAEWERRAKELLERIKYPASKEEIREEVEVMERFPEPGLEGGDGVRPRKLVIKD